MSEFKFLIHTVLKKIEDPKLEGRLYELGILCEIYFKVKAKKLFGDAKERRYAKKKEKEKNGMHQSDKNFQKHNR